MNKKEKEENCVFSKTLPRKATPYPPFIYFQNLAVNYSVNRKTGGEGAHLDPEMGETKSLNPQIRDPISENPDLGASCKILRATG